MNLYKTILVTLFFFIPCCLLQAQSIERYNTFSYSVNEGLLQSTMGDIAFDQHNFCWLSFPNGIQKFDGRSFTQIEVQAGLPDDKNVKLFVSNNGSLLISHSRGVSRYNIASNSFSLVYRNPDNENTAASFLGQDGDIIYLFTESRKITGLDASNYKVISETTTSFTGVPAFATYRPIVSKNIIEHKIALLIDSRIHVWDLQAHKEIQKSAPVANNLSHPYLKSGHEVYFSSRKDLSNLELYNFKTNSYSSVTKPQQKAEIGIRSVIYTWHNKTLLSYNNHLYEMSSDLKEIKSELVNFHNQPVAGNSNITRITEDNFGNLFLLTINNGIRKIIKDNYPLKYYGTLNKPGNYVLTILPDKKNNRILAGTYGNGILIFDTLQQIIKQFSTLPGRKKSFNPNIILKKENGDYLVFIFGEKSAWLLNRNLNSLVPVPVSSSLPEGPKGIGYYANCIFQDEERAIVQSEGRLFNVDFKKNIISVKQVFVGNILSAIFYQGSIIVHTDEELVFIDGQSFTIKEKKAFKNTGGVRCFATDAANNIYVGTNKGVFKINAGAKLLDQFNKETGLPDECIYAMVFDKEGSLWCSTNKGTLKINKDKSVFQLQKEDGLQENEFNTNAVAKAADGELFFGGVNGISSFYPAAIKGFDEKINLLFTNIKINNEKAFKDTGVWNITRIELPYNKNSLSFDFVAMASNNPHQYIYQYKMDGIDKEWVQNEGMQTVRYFLPPGEYIFKIAASRFFDKDAKVEKQIRIVINPPFWKTWWFLVSVAVSIISLIVYTVYRYSRRKYLKKLAQLENDHKMQLERERISRDLHDSVGAYANAVLYNTELLQEEVAIKERNALMDDLKFASKDIITSLRETVWALKKENYSAEDCLLRIKNFIQPLARYYPQIIFKVEGEAPDLKPLHYTKALNVVRIVQEAVTNAIKHAAPRSIIVSSGKKQGRWELSVSDDGKSFDYDATNTTDTGNGLKNMKQRVADSGFELSIHSQEGGKGTVIRILI